MSIRKSGLWCDLCNKPILLSEYWHITLGPKRWPGHSCEGCFKKQANKDNVHTDEAREALK